MSISEVIANETDIPKSEFERMIGLETQAKIKKALEKGHSVELKSDSSGKIKVFEKKLTRIE